MKKLIIAILITFFALGFAFCGGSKAATNDDESMIKEAAKQNNEVELAYVEWSSEVASTHVVQAVLQEKMGYDVSVTPVSAAAMWTAVGSGDVDGMVAAWLKTTHDHYLEQVEDNVINLGPNLEGTRIGLVVPAYVEIDSIAEMNNYADEFDGKIIGIDPGAGIMSTTEQAIDEYNLTNFKLVEGSGATMTAALADAYRNKDWIAVTGWTPHWKFGRWDLKYLEDPKGIYGEEEWISTIVREGLEDDMPEVYKLLDNFYWTPNDMAEVMIMNQEGGDPYDNAVKWINENPELVNSWINGTSKNPDVRMPD
jgi:glycine betaine/proline transport system substrate-binding protein